METEKQGHMVKFHEAVQSNAAVSLACLFQKILTNFINQG